MDTTQPTLLPHTIAALVGRSVIIRRDGYSFFGTIRKAFPSSVASAPGLGLILDTDDGGSTGFHLPFTATVEGRTS